MYAEGLCLDFLVYAKEAQIGCDCGAWGTDQVSEFCLGIGLTGLQQIPILEGLF